MTALRDFQRACAGDGLRVLLQPIARLGDGGALREIAGVECLSRGPRGTNLEPPAVLFSYARQVGREAEIDLACIRMAVGSLAELERRHPIFLNVHGVSLEKGCVWTRDFRKILDDAGVAPSEIVLEIVENLTFRPSPTFTRNLETLRGFGVRFALDDFGSRNSGFSLMLDCRPEFLKLDARLVRGCDTDPLAQSILASLVLLSEKSGAVLIAEGVETVAERDTLVALGIPAQQGFIHFPLLELECYCASFKIA